MLFSSACNDGDCRLGEPSVCCKVASSSRSSLSGRMLKSKVPLPAPVLYFIKYGETLGASDLPLVDLKLIVGIIVSYFNVLSGNYNMSLTSVW